MLARLPIHGYAVPPRPSHRVAALGLGAPSTTPATAPPASSSWGWYALGGVLGAGLVLAAGALARR